MAGPASSTMSTSDERPDVSLVIPSYNMAETLGRCLRSVGAQRAAPSFELIVVDSSSDGSADVVGRVAPDARLVHVPERLGPAAARNLGASHASAPVIAFLDADCAAPPHWLQRLIDRLRATGGIVGGAVRLGRPRRPLSLCVHLLEFSSFLPEHGARQSSFVPSCNMAMAADTWTRLGGFDERFDRPGGEDLDLCARHRAAGGAVWFDGDVVVDHAPRQGARRAHQHLFRQGRASATARSRATGLEGQLALQHPGLAPALLPLRFARVFKRLARRPRGAHLATLWLANAPVGVSLLAAWTAGFYAAAREQLVST